MYIKIVCNTLIVRYCGILYQYDTDVSDGEFLQDVQALWARFVFSVQTLMFNILYLRRSSIAVVVFVLFLKIFAVSTVQEAAIICGFIVYKDKNQDRQTDWQSGMTKFVLSVTHLRVETGDLNDFYQIILRDVYTIQWDIVTGYMGMYMCSSYFDAGRNHRMVRTCFNEIRIKILSTCSAKYNLTFIPCEATLDVDRVAETSFAVASLEHKYESIHGIFFIMFKIRN